MDAKHRAEMDAIVAQTTANEAELRELGAAINGLDTAAMEIQARMQESEMLCQTLVGRLEDVTGRIRESAAEERVRSVVDEIRRVNAALKEDVAALRSKLSICLTAAASARAGSTRADPPTDESASADADDTEGEA